MGKIIFRRIGGRLVPLHVQSKIIAKPLAGTKDVSIKLTKAGEEIGYFWAQQSAKRPNRFIVGSQLAKEFRGHGLGKEFYGKMAKAVKRLGGKFLTGSTDNVATIKKIRESIGKTRSFVSPGKYTGTTFVTLLKRKK